jgi:hypothetical protein
MLLLEDYSQIEGKYWTFCQVRVLDKPVNSG